MGMTYRRRNYSRRGPVRSHWIDLRYAGRCKVCGDRLPAGARAYYDGAARTVTCTSLECASADGLTRQDWHGAPTSGRYVEVLAERRIGDPAPTTTYNRGRCIDAPCCGCCS